MGKACSANSTPTQAWSVRSTQKCHISTSIPSSCCHLALPSAGSQSSWCSAGLPTSMAYSLGVATCFMAHLWHFQLVRGHCTSIPSGLDCTVNLIVDPGLYSGNHCSRSWVWRSFSEPCFLMLSFQIGDLTWCLVNANHVHSVPLSCAIPFLSMSEAPSLQYSNSGDFSQ